MTCEQDRQTHQAHLKDLHGLAPRRPGHCQGHQELVQGHQECMLSLMRMLSFGDCRQECNVEPDEDAQFW